MAFTLARILSGKNLNDLFDSLLYGYETRSYMKPLLVDVATKNGNIFIKLSASPYIDAEMNDVDVSGTIPDNEVEAKILEIFGREVLNTNISPCIVSFEGYGQYTGIVKMMDDLGIDCESLTRQRHEGAYSVRPIDMARVWFCGVKYEVTDDLSRDVIRMVAMEKCDIMLSQVLEKYYDSPFEFIQWKSFMFMIIYTLYQLNSIYPGFMHNDLHVDNIMFKYDDAFKFDATNMRFQTFLVADTIYSVPYFGITPKIIDFGLASLPSQQLVSRSSLHLYHFAKTVFKNDLARLMHEMWIFPGIRESTRMSELLYRIDPKQIYRNSPWVAQRRSDEMRSYEEILAGGVWGEYRDNKIPASQVYAKYGLS